MPVFAPFSLRTTKRSWKNQNKGKKLRNKDNPRKSQTAQSLPVSSLLKIKGVTREQQNTVTTFLKRQIWRFKADRKLFHLFRRKNKSKTLERAQACYDP